MKGFGTTATLLLALASGQAVADARTMPTFAAPSFQRAAGAEFARLPQPARAQGTFRPARQAVLPATRQIREQALQGLLSAQEPAFEEAAGGGRLNLHFQRPGGFRDLQRGYREMCNRVSSKIWDEPNGKRVRFDVAGKPGFGVEIPLGRAKR